MTCSARFTPASEWRFARNLQALLGIDDRIATTVVDVLRIKNAA